MGSFFPKCTEWMTTSGSAAMTKKKQERLPCASPHHFTTPRPWVHTARSRRPFVSRRGQKQQQEKHMSGVTNTATKSFRFEKPACSHCKQILQSPLSMKYIYIYKYTVFACSDDYLVELGSSLRSSFRSFQRLHGARGSDFFLFIIFIVYRFPRF